MKTLTLKRVAGDAQGTYGVLIDGTRPFAVTLERPWVGNQPNVSCIPAGTYACSRKQSPRFGNTFEITGVPGRSHILFHAGNTAADTEGCVLVAEEFTTMRGGMAVGSSRRGFSELMAKLAGQESFNLVIKEV